jgi:hypothetical protein
MFTRPRDEVLRALGVPAGARVIAAGTALNVNDGPRRRVVATLIGLHVTGWDEPLRWDHIESASWDEPVLDLVINTDQGSRLEQLRLDRAGELPAAVRDRVTASVITSERVEVAEGRFATFAARRRSDDGDIRWTVVFDSGLDPNDPDLRAAADATLYELRQSLGI